MKFESVTQSSKIPTDATPALEHFAASKDLCSILFRGFFGSFLANLNHHQTFATEIAKKTRNCSHDLPQKPPKHTSLPQMRKFDFQALTTTKSNGSAVFSFTLKACGGRPGTQVANSGRTFSLSKENSLPTVKSSQESLELVFATVFLMARAFKRDAG